MQEDYLQPQIYKGHARSLGERRKHTVPKWTDWFGSRCKDSRFLGKAAELTYLPNLLGTTCRHRHTRYSSCRFCLLRAIWQIPLPVYAARWYCIFLQSLYSHCHVANLQSWQIRSHTDRIAVGRKPWRLPTMGQDRNNRPCAGHQHYTL